MNLDGSSTIMNYSQSSRASTVDGVPVRSSLPTDHIGEILIFLLLHPLPLRLSLNFLPIALTSVEVLLLLLIQRVDGFQVAPIPENSEALMAEIYSIRKQVFTTPLRAILCRHRAHRRLSICLSWQRQEVTLTTKRAT